MKRDLVTREFSIKGMHCQNCKKIIELQALSVDGVNAFKADYAKGTGVVTYDEGKTDLDEIFDKIKDKGYQCKLEERKTGGGIKSASLSVGLIVVLIGAYMILSGLNYPVPALNQNTSIILIFIIGLITGFHCMAMCGGFVVSYSSKASLHKKGLNLRSHIEYGFGKTLSYAIIGGICGLAGSFLMITPQMMSIVTLIGGVFLVLFGLNMLDTLNWFKIFRLKTPGFIDRFIAKRKDSSPLVIGLLTGLMFACGPLQALYVYAAASGSPFLGALYLAVFSLGTLPVLISFGIFTSIISSKLTNKIVRYSGILVVILGLLMINRGVDMYGGYQTPIASMENHTNYAGTQDFQVVQMNMTHSFVPDRIALKKGIPVKWMVDNQDTFAKGINVPKLGLKLQVKPGLNIYEFTPNETGTIPFSCWMDVFHGTVTVN